MSPSQKTHAIPQLITVGNLSSLVRERGRNNDDGDGWSIKAEDALRPPVPLARGVLSFLRHKRS